MEARRRKGSLDCGGVDAGSSIPRCVMGFSPQVRSDDGHAELGKTLASTAHTALLAEIRNRNDLSLRLNDLKWISSPVQGTSAKNFSALSKKVRRSERHVACG